MKTLIQILPIVIGLSACSMIQRHPDSGYATEFLSQPEEAEVPLNIKSQSSGWNPPKAARKNDVWAKAANRTPQALSQPRAPEIIDLIQSSDIGLGMSQADVRESWGNPLRREVAGNSTTGNERWTYREFLPSKDGYTPQDRVVYFYQGKVIGWKTSK